MIQKQRIHALNCKSIQPGRYVLYWMQAAQRAEYNHALEYAIEWSDKLSKPLVAVFALADVFPQANLRHYLFMLEGLAEVKKDLYRKGVQFVIQHGDPETIVTEIGKNAELVVTDEGYLKIQKNWRGKIASEIPCSMYEVETNLIVPVREASDKENYSAGVFRPRINSCLDKYLLKITHRNPRKDSLGLKFKSFDIENTKAAVLKLNIDKTVTAVDGFKGGTSQAKKLLKNFIKHKLDDYESLRNDPCADGTSGLSPYLHFGNISPLYIALEILKTNSPGKAPFLEQLIVRRELSHNFVFYNKNYDSFESLPAWAKRSLNFHKVDKRKYQYSPDQFENSRTHDPYWNAAQTEMVVTGKMHGYMRMYWGKKILEWSKTPQQAYKTAIYLNNKYELDGRDPNAFAGVSWCFGKHDRPWGERRIFGKVRYMNDAGLKRKFDPDEYVRKIQNINKRADNTVQK